MGLARIERASPSVLPSSLLVVGTMLMALSVYFDAWWHEAIGRESFWIPPHLGIYAGLFTSLAGFSLLLRTARLKLHPGLWVYAAGITGVVVAGYADELWHERFGVEKIGTLQAIWSPTHVAALVGGTIAALGIISHLSTMSRRPEVKDTRLGWLLAAEFGVLVSIATLLLLPLGPETPFRLLGVWGAPTVAFAILSMRFFGSALSEKPWALTLITSFNWTGNAVLLSNHAPPLLVLQLLAVGLVPPFLADVIIQRGRRLKAVRNAYVAAGLVWGIIFGAFFYPLTNGLVFTGTSIILDPASLLMIGASSAAASVLAGFLAGQTSEQWLFSTPLSVAKADVRVGARA